MMRRPNTTANTDGVMIRKYAMKLVRFATSERRIVRWGVAIFLMCSLLTGSLALATKYVYDESGRLTVMVNEASGESARYVYDKVGNLLRIERLAAGEVAVFAFAPARGSVGVAVRIDGQGFDPVASANVVSFNGVPATVTLATATSLEVEVPAAATTGPLRVTIGTRSAEGPADFVVDPGARPPLISSVTPWLGPAGANVTIAGERLYPAADLTTVRVGNKYAPIVTASDSQLVFVVPARTGSAQLSVSTPYGTAVTEREFLVLPTDLPPSDAVDSGYLTLDGPARDLSVTSENQALVVLLKSDYRGFSSLLFSQLESASVGYALYGPDNRVLTSGSASAGVPSVHLPKLSEGAYLLVLKSSAVQKQWNLKWEKDAALAVDGPGHPVATSIANRSTRVVFTVPADQESNLGIGISDLVFTPGTGAAASIYVMRPDGSQLQYSSCDDDYGGCGLNLPNLVAGTYTVNVVPPSGRTMAFKAWVSADATGVLSVGVPQDVSLARRGQNGRYTFSGTAGQLIGLKITNQLTQPASRPVYYTVYRPNGEVLKQISTVNATTMNLTLPDAGEYTVHMEAQYDSSAFMQLTLLPGQDGTIAPDGDGRVYGTQGPDQTAQFTFTAAQGANLGIGISDLVFTPGTGATASIYVMRPDGSQLQYSSCDDDYGGCGLNLPNLVAGTYTVNVVPPSGRTMAFKAWVSADTTGVLSIGVPQDVSLARRGQNGRYTFSGTAGQLVGLKITNQLTQPASRSVYYTVYRPNGEVLKQINTVNATTMSLTLPDDGAYLIHVDPIYDVSAGMKLEVYSSS